MRLFVFTRKADEAADWQPVEGVDGAADLFAENPWRQAKAKLLNMHTNQSCHSIVPQLMDEDEDT